MYICEQACNLMTSATCLLTVLKYVNLSLTGAFDKIRTSRNFVL